jgi:hypothetical protein
MNARTYDEFMAEKEKSDPLLFAAVAVLYPVLTHYEMRHRQDKEIGYDEEASYAANG